MRLITLLIILVLFASSANAIIKDNASILLINDNEAKFISLNYENGGYTSKILQISKFFDWKDLTLADIDGDNYNELIAIRDIGPDVYIYDFINNELLQKTDAKNVGSFTKDLEWVKIIPINLDKDKDDELLLLNNRYGRFYLIDRFGVEFSVQLISDSNNVLYNDWISMDSGDIDKDGILEIVLLRKNTQPIYIIKYSNGQLTPWKDAKKIGDVIGDSSINAMALGDLNNDEKLEIIVAAADGKIYSVSYSNVVTILAQSEYKRIVDMDIADVDKDGKNELVLLRSDRNPLSIYKLVGDTLVEKVVANFFGEVGWVGVSAGKFMSEIPIEQQEETQLPVEQKEEPKVVEEPKIEEPIGQETEEKSNLFLYFLIIILFIAVIIIFFLMLKSKFKENTKEEKLEKKGNVYLDTEEKETMWPVSKRLKDLDNIKDFIKKSKK